MNITLPISNIIIDIENGCSLDELISLLKLLIVQINGIVFIIKPVFNLDIYFNFSNIDATIIKLDLLECIATNLKHLSLNKINIIIKPKLFNEQILDFIAKQNFKLKILLNSNSYRELKFKSNKYNQFIDINFLISDDLDLKNIYKKLSKFQFSSIDFILPDKINLNFFAKKLVNLANYYFIKNSAIPILCINSLVDNYFKFKLGNDIIFRNASLAILLNGDILKTENYLYAGNKTHFSEKLNLYREKLINVLITNEYYKYFSTSSLNILDLHVTSTVNIFSEAIRNEYWSQAKKYPLFLFYRYYIRYYNKYVNRIIENARNIK